MKVFHHINALPEIPNAVLTIGTFDGVHCGHQQIIATINRIAHETNGQSVILTFHPHPRLVINPDDTSLKLLNTLEEKIISLEKYGVNNLIVTPFSQQFSEMSAHDYVKDFLWKHIKPKVIVIGYDHRFGKDRKGGIHTFNELSSELNFKVEEISQQTVDDIAVSSTKVRNALAEGKAELANHLLGHPYSLTGKVVKGESLGKHLGFPTANIDVADANKLIPKAGIYATKTIFENITYNSMLYIGNRPTFKGKNQTIEVNIFDFAQDIYDKEITVALVAEIRDDIKFHTADALINQLRKDKEAAEKLLLS
jgi:riboflavin kinase/FMN adenylyltransferase